MTKELDAAVARLAKHTCGPSCAEDPKPIHLSREAAERIAEAMRKLADKVDATSECDHKRQSCADIGCIGQQVKAVRAALAELRLAMGAGAEKGGTR